MMKILSRGKTDRRVRRFRCVNCGCIFSTDAYTKDFSMIEDPESSHVSNCPKCLSHSYEVFDTEFRY